MIVYPRQCRYDPCIERNGIGLYREPRFETSSDKRKKAMSAHVLTLRPLCRDKTLSNPCAVTLFSAKPVSPRCFPRAYYMSQRFFPSAFTLTCRTIAKLRRRLLGEYAPPPHLS